MPIDRGPQSCEVFWIALTVVQPLTRNSNNGSLWAKYAGEVRLYMETLWGISFHVCLFSSTVSRGCFSRWSSNVAQQFLEMNLKSERLCFLSCVIKFSPNWKDSLLSAFTAHLCVCYRSHQHQTGWEGFNWHRRQPVLFLCLKERQPGRLLLLCLVHHNTHHRPQACYGHAGGRM